MRWNVSWAPGSTCIRHFPCWQVKKPPPRTLFSMRYVLFSKEKTSRNKVLSWKERVFLLWNLAMGLKRQEEVLLKRMPDMSENEPWALALCRLPHWWVIWGKQIGILFEALFFKWVPFHYMVHLELSRCTPSDCWRCCASRILSPSVVISTWAQLNLTCSSGKSISLILWLLLDFEIMLYCGTFDKWDIMAL